MDDIIKENENYRVRLELDECPEKPYDDGATPILSREFRGYYGSRWEAVNKQGEPYANALNELAGRIRRELEEETIARYLRIFHGAYSVEWDSSEDFRYVAFDTTEWREEMGLTEEHMTTSNIDRSTLAEGSLEEVIAWATGDVYGVIEERKLNRHTVTVYTDPVSGDEVRKSDTSGEYWETEEAVWGYYGRKWAEQAATEAFDAQVNRQK